MSLAKGSFLGVEDTGNVNSAVWYEKEPKGFLSTELLKKYRSFKGFDPENASNISIPLLITEILNELGFDKTKKEIQKLPHDIFIYPRDYFYPYSFNWDNNIFTDREPIKKFNRVDFRLKNTDYWVEGIVEEIRDNNKILIKYKNNNNFMPIVREEVSINDQRLAMPGLYTKIEGNNNDLLASTTLNFDLSKKNTLELNLSKNYDDSDLNLSKTKLLSNKTNCPDNDDNNSLIDENEYEFAIELLTINLLAFHTNSLTGINIS